MRMFTNGHEFSSILFLSIRVSFMSIGVAPQAISLYFLQLGGISFQTMFVKAILQRKTAHFAHQNDSFCLTKWAVLEFKMGHFERVENVKKTQGACRQHVRTSSYFACTRPSDFNFRTMALTEGKNGCFVRFFDSESVAGIHQTKMAAPCQRQPLNWFLLFVSNLFLRSFRVSDRQRREPYQPRCLRTS